MFSCFYKDFIDLVAISFVAHNTKMEKTFDITIDNATVFNYNLEIIFLVRFLQSG